jgi:glyoxylase-like metal-dependent hydrolase (beta-lactamase superfamily II)
MSDARILDLNFKGIPGAIASYLIPHRDGVVLVEAGPGSTTDRLQAALGEEGYQVSDVTDVLLTHIHLDHAGAAGWLAGQGARIHVHPNGAPHLINPEKLISSATRIYGDRMDTLWGAFLPVPEHRLSIPQDGDVIEIGELRFRAVNTPGHANHHYAYLVDDIAFMGDVGGVRLGGVKHLRLPMPPPEFDLEKWRGSMKRLREEFDRAGTRRVAPTHFGIHTDLDWHMEALDEALDEVEAWMNEVMPKDLDPEALRAEFIAWANEVSVRKGMPAMPIPAQGAVNPPFMSADGIKRYWNKRQTGNVAT